MTARSDTAKLVAQLTLDDKGYSRGIDKAITKTGQLETTIGRLGETSKRGLQTGARNVGLIGVAAVGGLALAVKSGLSDLAELENAITSVDGAIATLGLTGQITGKQVADWANEIEQDVDAAFDDKAITQAATTLLRFGKVTPKTLKPALEVVTDLAAKTGDVESAAELLAKALADPTKAAGRLSRVGVILTDQQKDQIDAMAEAGDVAGAQAVLLDAVAKSTAGAAKAMAGPYQDAINKTNDAIEDGRKALAVGFLPVITKVADKLSKIVADPQALASIEAFGKTLAGGLDSLISLAERLPWASIGQSLQIAGAGAKALLDAFVSLPPWVQTAVITGWGLNKLTGGALGSIVGELGKGLIKGVLGITAGTVVVKAATVTGAPGVGGPVGTAPAGGGGTLGKVAGIATKVFIVGAVAGVFAELVGELEAVKQENAKITEGVSEQGAAFAKNASLSEMRQSLKGLLEYQSRLANNPLTAEGIAYALNVHDVATTIGGEIERLRSAIATEEAAQRTTIQSGFDRLDATTSAAAVQRERQFASEMAESRQLFDRQYTQGEATRAGVVASMTRASQDSNAERAAIADAAARQAEAQRAGAYSVTGAVAGVTAAVKAKDLSVTVQNFNNLAISIRDQATQFTRYNQYYRVPS